MALRTDRRPDKAAQAAREDQNETSDLWFDFGHGDEEAGTAAGARCEDDRAAPASTPTPCAYVRSADGRCDRSSCARAAQWTRADYY